MKIIADENIPYVKDAFTTIGEVQTISGRDINPESIKDAQVLLVRSVTKVNKELLEKNRVEFVATATIGTDHIDLDYLKGQGIGFASAQGSNANSVAEYVMASLFVLNSLKKISIEKLTLGVVGVGNVGSKVVKKAQSLGIKVLQNDPPLKRKTQNPKFLPIDELMQSDIVTLHVPLTFKGEDMTYHLFNEERIYKMKPGSILFNTSRGAVVTGGTLKKALKEKHLSGAVIDVWENEPDIDIELAQMVDIGTPHIAGYSLDGKVNGTEMIYKAACEHFYLRRQSWNRSKVMPEPEIPFLKKDCTGKKHFDIIGETIKKIYDIEKDDRELRGIISIPESQRGKFFDSLRKNYPVRREFFNTKIEVDDDALRDRVQGLGFNL